MSEKCSPVVGSSRMNRRAAPPGGRHVGGQFQPLGLAAGEGVGRLAEADVVQAHVDQPLQPGLHLGPAAEKVNASRTVISSTSAMLRPR